MIKFSCTMVSGEDIFFATLIAESPRQAKEMAAVPFCQIAPAPAGKSPARRGTVRPQPAARRIGPRTHFAHERKPKDPTAESGRFFSLAHPYLQSWPGGICGSTTNKNRSADLAFVAPHPLRGASLLPLGRRLVFLSRGSQASPAGPLLPRATSGDIWPHTFGGRPE